MRSLLTMPEGRTLAVKQLELCARSPALALTTALSCLAIGCRADIPSAPRAEVTQPQLTIASGGGLTDISQEHFGTFRGIDFVRYSGRFEGTTDLGAFRVPFTIIGPKRPRRANGRIFFEPPHFSGVQFGRDAFLGREFLFRRGFVHASVGWGDLLGNVLEVGAEDLVIADGAGGFDVEIIERFARLLRSGGAHGLTGAVRHLYVFGYSQSTLPLWPYLLSPDGIGLFDLTLLVGTGWPIPLLPGSPDITGVERPIPTIGVGKVIVLGTESDVVRLNHAALRPGDEQSHYRVYEVSGGQHIPDVPGVRGDSPVGLPPVPLDGSNPLDWTPVLRALFLAGDQWVIRDKLPPASVLITTDESGDPDPVYGVPTGIARDQNLNALGGIRLPDMELGRGQFIATDASVPPPFTGLVGQFVDLQCTPLPDGSVRFPSHGAYVSGVALVARDLVRRRFLLPQDAARILKEAAQSEVGRPKVCAER